jgi:hypothetical protein
MINRSITAAAMLVMTGGCGWAGLPDRWHGVWEGRCTLTQFLRQVDGTHEPAEMRSSEEAPLGVGFGKGKRRGAERGAGSVDAALRMCGRLLTCLFVAPLELRARFTDVGS